MAARGMVDLVLAAAGGAPLKAAELGRQPRQIEQLDAAGVQERQEVVIKVALRPGALLELDPVLGETSRRPLAGEFVADNLRHPITAQQGGALLDRFLGIERRPDLEQRVEHADRVAAEMGDRQGQADR